MDKLGMVMARLPFLKLPMLLIIVLISEFSSSVVGTEIKRKPNISIIAYTQVDSIKVTPLESQFQTQNSYANDFISKEGNDFTISAQTDSVIIACQSAYPITWKFPEQFGGQIMGMVESIEYRLSDLGQHQSNPANTGFQLLLKITITYTHFLNNNITCISADGEPTAQSSIHVYLLGKNPLQFQGRTLYLPVEPSVSTLSVKTTNSNPFVLPCRPSSPLVKLALEKESAKPSNVNTEAGQNRSWTSMHSSNDGSLRFDPKVGFIIDRISFGESIFGLYRCSVADNGDDEIKKLSSDKYVLLNVTKIIPSKNGSNVAGKSKKFERKEILQGNASVSEAFDYRAIIPEQELICCSGVKGKPPRLRLVVCNSPFNCEKRKWEMSVDYHHDFGALPIANKLKTIVGVLKTLRGDKTGQQNNKSSDGDCDREIFRGSDALIVCQGENVDYAEEFIEVFNPEINGPVVNRSKRVRENMLRNYSGITLINPSNLTPLSERIWKFSVKPDNPTMRMALLVAEMLPSGLFGRSKVDGIHPIMFDRLDDQFLDLSSLMDFSSHFSRIFSALRMKEYDRDVFYEGESLNFICLGVLYFYANGNHFRLNWKNGTRTTLPRINLIPHKDMLDLYLAGNAVMFDRMGLNLLPIFSGSLVASQEMSSIDCWMPLRNSGKWDKLSKSLKILPSVAPRFKEKEVENLYVYVGDTGKVITCTVVEGAPVPTFRLTKDGHEMANNFEPKDKATAKRSWSLRNGTMNNEMEYNDAYLMKLSLTINDISPGDQIVWQCVVENVNGTVTRTIMVFVLERPPIALPISLGIGGLMCLIFIGIGIKYLCGKRNSKSTQT